ncbi:helix-turn-helix transcriptional regulator [Jeongeupia wiesaeckerbachi]|uniref:helix-turn-helix domain-containing protein n=1 Tax=Jeongeupia wiesaeckerbachi TaxID=3051218 RepID=UPI003D8068E5
MKETTPNPREVRRRLGLNQQEFWSKIGVTQSGGSRYESGRNMPRPVRELLRVVHIEEVDLGKINREDYLILEYLKEMKPELYETLRLAATRDREPVHLQSAQLSAR